MINRPLVPTIYPPVAEAYFLGVHYLPGGSDSSTPIQATTALVAVLTTVMLMFGLGRLGRDPRMAALWSWCPTVALEAGNSAHVDVVAVAITAAALLILATARTTRRTVLGGILLGLAVATKLIPALTVPAVLRRRWITVSLAAGGAFVTVYIPHVLAVGSKVSRVHAGLPAGGRLHQRDEVRHHRPVPRRPRGHRRGGPGAGRGRTARAAVLRP